MFKVRRACRDASPDKPPSGANWIHEIKHDGYRLMARRDPVGIRLITRRGNDWTQRSARGGGRESLKVRSCLIDGEVVCCDDRGLAVFQALRRRQNEERAFLYAFDLLELNGDDLRREPIEVRKATLASILRKARHGVRLNEHLEHDCGLTVFQHACKMGLEGIVSKRLGIALSIGTLAGLAQVQEPGGACGETGGGRGLGAVGAGETATPSSPNADCVQSRARLRRRFRCSSVRALAAHRRQSRAYV